jgi:hypothetical protein
MKLTLQGILDGTAQSVFPSLAAAIEALEKTQVN